MQNNQIGKETSIEELVEMDSEMNDVLYEYGLHCGNCFAAGFDTLEEGAKMHGLEDDEIEELIQELNKKAESKKIVDPAVK
jgi:hybrid cluster-associated redox disulfide protein